MVYRTIIIGLKITSHKKQLQPSALIGQLVISNGSESALETLAFLMSQFIKTVCSLKVKLCHLQEFCHDFIAFSNTGSGAAAGQKQTHTHIRDMVHIREQSFFCEGDQKDDIANFK